MITALQSLPAKILVVLAIIGASFAAGYLSGINAGAKKQLADTVEAFQKRGKIDEAVDGRSSYQLCRDVGGLPEQCDELRGMDETTGAK